MKRIQVSVETCERNIWFLQKYGGRICILWMTSIVSKSHKRGETTQVSSLFLYSKKRTSGLLLRRQAHFNLPHGNAARSAAFPTGSNPVTRTKREETTQVSSLFLCSEQRTGGCHCVSGSSLNVNIDPTEGCGFGVDSRSGV